MGTILAIYIAAAGSFLAIIQGHEDKQNRDIFKGTTRELKQNILFVIIIFIIHMFLLVITPKEVTSVVIPIVLKSFKTLTFVLYIYALYELSKVLFSIRETLNKNRN